MANNTRSDRVADAVRVGLSDWFIDWLLLTVALTALVLGMIGSIPIPSVFGQNFGIHADRASIPFAVFFCAGLWIVLKRAQNTRVILWVGPTLVFALYVAGLSFMFDEVIEFVMRCATSQ